MKRVISVWMAAARTVVWKLLLTVVLMAGAETALFWLALRNEGVSFYGYFFTGTGSWMQAIFTLAMLAFCGVLCLQGSQFSGGKMVYTLRRLPVREEAVTVLWALLHMGCIVILWACQLAVVFAFWALSGQYGGRPGGDFELFLTFYESGFLHSLLPLADAVRHVRNILWIIALGFNTAAFGFFQRRGRYRAETLILLVVGCYLLGRGIGNPGVDVVASIFWLILLAAPISSMWEVCHEAD